MDDEASLTRINLRGIAIGNGLTVPSVQYGYYLAMMNNTYGIPLTAWGPDQFDAARSYTMMCVNAIMDCQAQTSESCQQLGWNYCDNIEDDACDRAWERCENGYFRLDAANVNPYDIRKECPRQSDPLRCLKDRPTTWS